MWRRSPAWMLEKFSATAELMARVISAIANRATPLLTTANSAIPRMIAVIFVDSFLALTSTAVSRANFGPFA